MEEYERVYVCIRVEDVPPGLAMPDKPGNCLFCGSQVVVSDATWKTMERYKCALQCLQCVPEGAKDGKFPLAPDPEVLEELRNAGVTDEKIDAVRHTEIRTIIDTLLGRSPARQPGEAWQW